MRSPSCCSITGLWSVFLLRGGLLGINETPATGTRNVAGLRFGLLDISPMLGVNSAFPEGGPAFSLGQPASVLTTSTAPI